MSQADPIDSVPSRYVTFSLGVPVTGEFGAITAIKVTGWLSAAVAKSQLRIAVVAALVTLSEAVLVAVPSVGVTVCGPVASAYERLLVGG